MIIYVEVWSIMVCNLDFPDPNKHEQTPEVVRERLWRLSDSCQHIVDTRGRCRNSHERTHADRDTHPHTCMHADTWHSRTHTHTRRRTHARAETHTHTHADSHTYTRTHTHQNRHARTHTHVHTRTHVDTHMPRTQTHTHTQIDMTRAEWSSPPRVCEPGKTGDCGSWAQTTERGVAWGTVKVFPYIQR